MNITSSPARFSPAFPQILYGIQIDNSSEVANIEVYNSEGTTLLGTKRVSGVGTHNINITPYLSGQLVIHPALSLNSALVKMPNRIVVSRIKLGATVFSTPHTAATESIGINYIEKRLSKMPNVRTINADGFDEFSFITNAASYSALITAHKADGGYSQIHINYISVQSDSILSMAVNMKDIMTKISDYGYKFDNITHLTVEVKEAGNVIISVKYYVKPPNPDGVTLYWLNNYGGIDCYTFDKIKNATLKCTKKRGERNGKYIVTQSSAIKNYTVVSRVEKTEMLSAISNIVSSPLVWINKNSEFTQVNVTSEATLITNNTTSKFELEFETIQKTHSQSL